MARDARLLDAVESAKHVRFISAEDRRDYAAAHALLRRMLTYAEAGIAPTAWRFEQTASGKPVLAPTMAVYSSIRFSLSHTRGLAACVISSDGEIGVDAECQSRNLDIEQLMPYVFSNDEQAQIRLLSPSLRPARFLDHWTLKEAYVKANGTGIDDEIQRASFDLADSKAIAASLPEQMGHSWWLALIRPSPDAHIAIAFTTASGRTPILDAAIVDASGREVVIRADRTSL